MARTRLVVTDLDGTFWHGPEIIHPRTLEAHASVLAAGIDVLIATGRRLQAVLRGTRPVGIEGSAVLMSGALGADLATGHEWHRTGFAPDEATAVLAAFRAQGVEPVAYVGSVEVDAIAGPGCATNLAHLDSFGETIVRDDPDAWAEAGVLVGFGVIGVRNARLDLVQASLGGVAERWFGPDQTYGGHTLMVAPMGVTKVDGIAPWCERHGYDPAEVLAVGDGENDVEMLAWAGTSVAVRGGVTESLDVDHLIDGPEDGGWAQLLDLL